MAGTDETHGWAAVVSDVRITLRGGTGADVAFVLAELRRLVEGLVDGETVLAATVTGGRTEEGTDVLVRLTVLAEDLLGGQVVAMALLRQALDEVRDATLGSGLWLDEEAVAARWATELPAAGDPAG